MENGKSLFNDVSDKDALPGLEQLSFGSAGPLSLYPWN